MVFGVIEGEWGLFQWTHLAGDEENGFSGVQGAGWFCTKGVVKHSLLMFL